MAMDSASKSSASSTSGKPHQTALFGLLSTRRFLPVSIAQFLGALNGKLYKSALVVLFAFHAPSWTSLSPETLISVAAGIFILPLLLFSATAGQLADKYDKAMLVRRLKLLEIGIMLIAVLAFYQHSLFLLIGALSLLGLQSAFLGPVTYAILPQHLLGDELIGGNAFVAAGTFTALLAGVLGAVVFASMGGELYCFALGCCLVAVVGYLVSREIPDAPAAVPELVVKLNPFAEMLRNTGLARRDRNVFFAILGISWFWFYGALLFVKILVSGMSIIGGNDGAALLLLAAVIVGIGLGSLLCAKLSGNDIEIGLVPVAAVGQAIFALDLFVAFPKILGPADGAFAIASLLAIPSVWRVLIDLLAFGAFCGLFLVPLYTLIQSRSSTENRGRVLSVSVFLNAVSLLCAAVVVLIFPGHDADVTTLFAATAVGCLVFAAFAYRFEPHLTLRFLTWLLIHSFYRVGKKGFEHIPKNGPAVLVCNHVSFVDSVVIMAAVRRPIRFVMDHRIHQTPVAGLLFRHSRTIPIATAKEDPAMKEAAFEEVARALKNGELIGLFPEGRITHTGEINHFRYGVGRIVTETPVAVVPMALRGLWGSFFSRRYGPAMSKPSLLRWLTKIELVVGEPIPPEMGSPEYLQEIVTELRGGLV